jgi:sarcosine oxidase subunit gamma
VSHLIAVSQLPAAARFSVRGEEIEIAAIGRAFAVALPRQPCRAATSGARSALWLGPDEWLLIAPAGEAGPLTSAMTAALAGEPASIVDISSRQIGIDIAGEWAAEAINAFNALDLDLPAFPAGMCTRTLFGKAEIVLWRTAADRFRIEIWRSFAPYVRGCLDEALVEFD